MRVDQGDGTFRENRMCRTRYRSEPVYDSWCDYTVDRWVAGRTERAFGTDHSPSWPSVHLVKTGECPGCEREGQRQQWYRVLLRPQSGEPGQCEVPSDVWRGMTLGSRWHVKQCVLLGDLRCEGAQPG